ncbi:hypothetical protein ABZ322_07865, partial [Streptomyces sp. NPDC006129]|uniref:hypothetical protein n=1 Tax=Streptomyces sp. NPDC006129 TaxID=3155348 RepID=UPI0033ADD578
MSSSTETWRGAGEGWGAGADAAGADGADAGLLDCWAGADGADDEQQIVHREIPVHRSPPGRRSAA